MTRAIALALLLGLAPLPLIAAEAGDAVFSERGPWDLGDDALKWQMTTAGPVAEGFRPLADGTITLSQGIDSNDQQPVLELTQKAGPIDRKIGPFPISSGDPVLTFFLEQTTRDMAALTGGSPHYIRNRMNDALFRGGELATTNDGVTARFQPFAADANADRMNGFQTLTLTFVMTEPGQPIRELRAATDAATGYDSSLVLQ